MSHLAENTILAVTAFLLSSPVSAASWVCEATNAAGYKLVAGDYKPQTFKVEDRYLVRPYKVGVDPAPNYQYQEKPPLYVAIEFGSDQSIWYFWSNLGSDVTASSLTGSSDMTFHNRASLLTINHVSMSIDLNHRTGTDYTPMFSIAKCARMD